MSARPARTAKQEQFFEQASQSAAGLIAAGGIEALTMRALATEMGLSLGTISYYFKSKSELLKIVFDDIVAQWSNVFTGIPTGAEFHREIAQRYELMLPLSEPVDQQWRMSFAFWQYSLHGDAQTRDTFDALMTQAMELAYQLIQQAIDDGAVDPSIDAQQVSAELSHLTANIGFMMLQLPYDQRRPHMDVLLNYLKRNLPQSG